ncbi:MAG: substrate-binding domain-containing protein [Ilumatobacteraceae bacterium]|nr:substrate-binding domain-containing protein [Ilumatobacter sp.]MCO5328785.1 substrate-binding domain-containing protein [Ilumatobacteraceae bacterium]
MRKFRSVLAVMAVAGIVVGACGDDEKSTDTTAGGSTETTAGGSTETTAGGGTETTAGGGTEDAGLAAARANVEAHLTADGSIGVTIPLTAVPEKHTIAWMECDVPTCSAYLTPGFKAATEALGWDLQIFPMKSADPGPGIQAAIDAGPDYIAMTGVVAAQFQPQVDAAKAAGIPLLSCFGTDAPSADLGIYMQCGDHNFVEKTGPLMADWAIVDSEGAANVLIVNIPDFPVLVVETDAYKAQMEQNCSSCKYTELNVTLDDLIQGKVPAAVASALQADPSINYVFASFGDLPGGVTAALDAAGLLDGVTVYGQDFSTIDLEEIVAGTQGAWSADPKGYAAWLMVDAAARLSLGMELTEERDAAALPTIIIDEPAEAQAIIDVGGDWMPPGAEDAFKALWGV